MEGDIIVKVGKNTGKRDMEGNWIREGDTVRSRFGTEGVIRYHPEGPNFCGRKRVPAYYIDWKNRAPYILERYEKMIVVIKRKSSNEMF